jgi:hypothetical protein
MLLNRYILYSYKDRVNKEYKYNEELKEKGLIDFNDQNNLALQYLKEDSELLEQ